ncbi:hypothetical protein ABZY93_10200, partial [Streptomyces smyrnaeus]
MPVLLAPMYGHEFAAPGAVWRLRAWWDVQATGVELSAATLLIVGVEEEELAGLGRVAYVAVPPGQARACPSPRGGPVIEVPAATIGELIDAVGSSMIGAGDRDEPAKRARSVVPFPQSERHAKPLWSHQLVRTAGALGVGAWLFSASMQPGQAQAADHSSLPQQQHTTRAAAQQAHPHAGAEPVPTSAAGPGVPGPQQDRPGTPAAVSGSFASGEPPATATPSAPSAPAAPAAPVTGQDAPADPPAPPDDGPRPDESIVNHRANEPAPGPAWKWGDFGGRTAEGVVAGSGTGAVAGPKGASAGGILGGLWNASAYLSQYPEVVRALNQSQPGWIPPEPSKDPLNPAFRPTRGEVSAGVAKPPGSGKKPPYLGQSGTPAGDFTKDVGYGGAVGTVLGFGNKKYSGITGRLGIAGGLGVYAKNHPDQVQALADTLREAEPGYATGQVLAEKRALEPTPAEISAGVAPPPGPSAAAQILKTLREAEPGYATGQALAEKRAQEPTPAEISAGVAPPPGPSAAAQILKTLREAE